MLGTRTKQVFSYGRRNQRIVDVCEEHDRLKKTGVSGVFEDLTTVQQRAPVVSKMKKRENTVLVKSKSPSPNIIHIHKKKRLSPVLSSARKKRTRVAQIINDIHNVEPSVAKPKLKAVGPRLGPTVSDNITPLRAPLGLFPLNAPDSPAVSGKLRKTARVSSAKGTPLRRLNKPFSPFVDIIVLDDEGRTVSQERRVSKTDVDNNVRNHGKPNHIFSEELPKVVDLIYSSGSDVEILAEVQPKPLKRLARRVKPARVYSDESDLDEDESPLVAPSLPDPKPKHILKYKPSASAGVFATKPLQARPSRLQVEVPTPSLPSSVPTITHPATPPRIASPVAFPPPQLQPTLPSQPTRYQHFPSPVARPRQLTPMRGRHGKRLFEPPSPPSPSTPTGLDLDFSHLNLNLGLSPSQPNASLSLPEPEIPQYLRPLLAECHQETSGLHEFSAFIETFPFDPIVQPADDISNLSDVRFRKIGEASYSEVFGIGDVVLKVIPLRDESPDAGANHNKLKMNVKYNEYGEEQDGPAPSDAKDVLKEIIVTRAMGELCNGFVKLLRTYIVRGRYPELLLELWDEFCERKGSESVRPDTFNVSQVYAIIVLPNGGPDLEAYTFTSANKSGWRQACSIFWQVTKALAHAEQLVSFEHRDLHWGQILVKNLPVPTVPPLKTQNQNQKSKPKSARLMMDDQRHGVRATLIDLGLARMDAGDGAGGERVHWTPCDEEVFMGEGDYQFDVYRIMREHNRGAWEEFNPLTNVMWLHYLTLKLLHSKRLKAPVTHRKGHVAASPSSSAAFAERDCYECLVDIEDWLGKCVAGVAQARVKVPAKGKGKRKPQVSAQVKTTTLLGPLCAGEVVGYGVKKGWIKSP